MLFRSLDKEEYMELNTEPEEPDSAENENTLETPEHAIHTGDIVRLTVVVVFPTPPFWLHTEIVLQFDTSFCPPF